MIGITNGARAYSNKNPSETLIHVLPNGIGNYYSIFREAHKDWIVVEFDEKDLIIEKEPLKYTGESLFHFDSTYIERSKCKVLYQGPDPLGMDEFFDVLTLTDASALFWALTIGTHKDVLKWNMTTPRMIRTWITSFRDLELLKAKADELSDYDLCLCAHSEPRVSTELKDFIRPRIKTSDGAAQWAILFTKDRDLMRPLVTESQSVARWLLVFRDEVELMAPRITRSEDAFTVAWHVGHRRLMKPLITESKWALKWVKEFGSKKYMSKFIAPEDMEEFNKL